jgi:hypothetical protein
MLAVLTAFGHVCSLYSRMLYFCGCQVDCTYITGRILPYHCMLVVIHCHTVVVTSTVWHLTAVNALEIIDGLVSLIWLWLIFHKLYCNNSEKSA